MPTIFHFDQTGIFDGATREIDDLSGAPPSWTFSQPPQTDENHWAYFVGPDWIVIDSRPSLFVPSIVVSNNTSNSAPVANGPGPTVI